MTAQDAIAIAFDEMVTMDAAPIKDAAKAQISGADSPIGGEPSLAEHLKTCEAQTPESCPKRKNFAQEIAASRGISLEEAFKMVDAAHALNIQNRAVAQSQKAPQVGTTQAQTQQPATSSTPAAPAPLSAEEAKQRIDALVADPEKILSTPGTPLAEPQNIDGMETKTDTAAAAATIMATSAEQGNPVGERAVESIKEQQAAEGTESPLGEGGASIGEQPQQPRMEFTSKGGLLNKTPSAEAVEIMMHDPSKKELYQQIVDAEERFQNATDYHERTDINEGIKQLKRMFYQGIDSSPISSSPESEAGEPPNPKKSLGEGSPSPAADKPNDQVPPNSPPPNSGKQEERPAKPMRQPRESQTPSDEEFRVGKNRYKVDGVTYTDVSGMGLFRQLAASFMAGVRGEGIIDGWDRINGTWNAIKRSAKGEQVRDGISDALFRDAVDDYVEMEGLSEDAQMEVEAISEMMDTAKTAKQKMAAIKEFQKWKQTYAQEIGELEHPQEGQTFKPLPNDYKGKKPPISILEKPKDFEADKEFGDKVASVLKESLGAEGLHMGDTQAIRVGPSATTIEFKVDPSFDIMKARSRNVLEKLHGALGSPVSKIGWVEGKPHVVAVEVTNKEMRDVSFSGCIASKDWKDFSDKASLPVTLGKDSAGQNVNLDLAKQPHTIVTGESGSGKSVFLMAAINSLEMAKTPDEARLVLLDPKNEFRSQDGSPHLLYPRAQKPQDIANVVSSLKSLMDDRIAKIGGVVKEFDPTKNEFQGNSDRNIYEYNKIHPEEKMPHVLLTFDEVASIMKNPDVADRVKQDLSQIMALGRSVGINCLLATQRPDVHSIPGDLKANAPAFISFKAAPDDAKASAAVKSLAGSGDFIMTDKEGKQTRGRGCFISGKEISAIPAYYRDHMNGGDEESEAPSLPQEYADGIAQAVEKGGKIAVEAIEGLEDAFKGALPEGWEVAEIEEGGKKYWKATPPTAKPAAEQPKEQKAETSAKEEEGGHWADAGNREDALAALEKMKERSIAKASEDYKKSKKTDADGDKLEEAKDKADKDYQKNLHLLDIIFPPKYEDAENPEESADEGAEEAGNPESPTPEEKKDEIEEEVWESPLQASLKPENRIKKARDRYMKAAEELEKDEGLNEAQRRKKLELLDKKYNDYVAQVKANRSDADIEAEKEQAAKAIRDKIPTVRNGRPIPGATHILKSLRGSGANIDRMPKALVEKARQNLPDGFEIDSDASGRPLWDGRKGFARDPNTGVYGMIRADGSFNLQIDPTNPKYKGVDSKEADKARKAFANNEDKSKDRELEEKYNYIAYGVPKRVYDKQPTNAEIVASAVVDAINRIN